MKKVSKMVQTESKSDVGVGDLTWKKDETTH